MSRFSLRSNAEQTKLSEQKEQKSKPLTNALKTPTKKSDNKKGNRNYVTEKEPPIQQTTAAQIDKSQKFNETIGKNEVEERDGHFSIICSLPLSRLTGIIEKLSLKTPHKFNSNAQADSPAKASDATSIKPIQVQCDEDGNIDGEDDVEEKQSASFDDDTSNSKSQDQIMIKTLCLYCEKKFSTCKMQQKHIEKFHSPQKDRRCSIRNSQVLTSPRSKSANRQTINRMLHNYPGCIYCKKVQNKPPYESNDPVRDFNGLFLHLTEQHADKYFGCKICIMRFQNVGKLMKHMQIVHNTLPEAQLKLSKDYNDISDEPRTEPTSPIEKLSPTTQQQQQLKQQRQAREHESPATNLIRLGDQTDVMNVEDTILTRLGLTQNRRRMPSNRKGVRLRRETAVPDILLKNDISMTGSTTSNILAAAVAAAATSTSTSPSKSRTKATAKSTNTNNDPDAVLFRVPARTDISSAAVFDENFYKEVTANVRNNLLFYLDGKLDARQSHNIVETEVSTDSSQTIKSSSLPLLLRSTIASTVTMQEILDSNLQETEIHVATNLPATTAFPTLLTAEQYCGDVRKIRRPHTKHSWKWKWDSVKKYKLINEGGKMVKKAKQPMLGLRDLSKLDMWTQLSMRQKHEKQLMLLQNSSNFEDFPSGEKRRLNDQLNAILDTRVLPHIILEQSEQAIIKVENDEFNFSTTFERRHLNEGNDDDDFYAGNIIGQTFADENFLSMLQLLPRNETSRHQIGKLVLSGEWARPRCYLCMCCGNKFEKLKSLEEHKMFRHSNIFSTHYEVVGRELLAGNLLQHLFIPKRALSYYIAPGAAAANNPTTMGSAKQLMKYRRINLSAEEESSDSVQSVSNSFVTTEHNFNLKTIPSTTDDCDTDTKTTLLGGVNTVSPSHSIQSSFSSSLTATSNQSLQQKSNSKESTRSNWNCSKCNRKCNGMGDLYRHMLDCSGDYIWSMAKKRKYRYYCGSKKRRPLHRQHSSELRKKKQEKTTKTQLLDNCTTEESSSNSFKPKTPPRPRPSDAESIKKMLENLPPKRVCKTIFPTVNKAKKTKKPKFITKLYNTKILRKTRARQLSNAIKRKRNTRFAAKTKTQNKTLNSVKCRSRKNINPKKQSNNSTIPTTDTDSKTGASGGGNSNPPTEKRSTPKKEQTLTNPDVDQQQTNKKDGSNEKGTKDTQNGKITKELIEQETIQNIEKAKNSDETDSKSKSENIAINSTEAAKIKENQNTQQNADNTKQKNSKATQQVENNCQRKRSKRISDCIAMLTGKLEEKLKTEITPTANVRIDEAILENTDSKQLTATAEKEKKTPKRKTISRRIIKTDIVTDDNEVVVVNDKTEQIPISKPILTIPNSITTTTTTTTTVVANIKTTKLTTTTTTPVATTKTTTSTISKTKITATINATPIKALNKNMPTITTPPSAPAKVILPPPVTPPTLVSIPIPIASTLHAVPVPLKVLQSHLPVYLPTVQQNVNAVASTLPPPPPPATLTLPVAATTLPLTLPNPNATSGLLPPITLLPPPPLIQAHVSPVLTAASTSPHCGAMEPLNLTSSKNAKKQTTAELRAQRPGMPARRQTICGFEARDLLTYNDMEPLDLSIKSKKSTTSESMPRTTIKPALVPVDFTTANNQNMKTTQAQAAPPTSTPEELTLKPSSIVQSTTLPPPPPLSLPATATTTPDTIFNKQFYSNLELLKIPQIRATGFLPTLETVNNLSNGLTVTALPLPIPLTTAVSNANNATIISTQPSQPQQQQQTQLQLQIQTQVQPQTQTQPQPQTPTQTLAPAQKVNNKKRGSTKANLDSTPAAKETNALNKRENIAKNKAIAKMDDEVINHIDDAINSVINAVKASLYESEIQEQAAAKVESKSVAPLVLENNDSKLTVELVLNKENNTQPSVAAPIIVEPIESVAPITLSTSIETTTTTKAATKSQESHIETTSVPEKSSSQSQQDIKKDQNIDQSPVIPITTTELPSAVALKSTTDEPLKPTLAITSKSPSIASTATTKSPPVVSTPKSTQAAAPKPAFTLTPKKRNLRSKTLDCRSQLMETLSTPTTTRLEKRCSPIVQLPATTIEQVQPENVVNTRASKKRDTLGSTDSILETPKEEKTLLSPTTTTTIIVEKTTSDSNKKDTEKIVEKAEKKVSNEPIKIDENKINVTNNEEKKTDETALQESTTNINLTLEENMSNINNTSSGFHSSSTPENGGDVKKKQRRRRKNELAAIVADQLLESFKIDKARRDSLKKLENMAYEKSEDLLLTGMLLMSSTKRTASSAVSFNQNAEKRNESAKRQKQQQSAVNTTTTSRATKSRNRITNDQNSAPTPVKTTIEEKELTTKTIEVEPIEITPRRGRRRTTRRKGVRTPLDNENLSKLKSSLESFSIGIEKQLSEFEARNTKTTVTTTPTSTVTTTVTNNVFNTTESKTRKKNLTEPILVKPTTTISSILRPSILSATLEQAQVATVLNTKTEKEKEKIDKSENTIDGSGGNNTKTATSTAPTATNFSRDPRLNKNIHKDEIPPTTLPSTATTDNVAIAIADNEDDNYLTEIAKNVNEKIMSAENEDFAFADNDDFEIGTEFNDDDDDDSNSKYSRPPTSMSVRSAPNFNDDHSNFGSMCDENTNTEVMDMDLDDEMSVYTSFSQDLGRGRGRKRRRRRSILLKRRPKKRRSSHDLSLAEKFECELCKKTFFAATSLAKHNMTLAHVSKVSEREYLLSNSGGKSLLNDFTKNFPKKQTKPAAGRRKRAQSMYLERPLDIFDCQSSVLPSENVVGNSTKNEASATTVQDTKTTQRLSLNPDERLFYECCNILKSADTTRLTRAEQENENQNSFLYPNTFLPPNTTTTTASVTSTPIQTTTTTTTTTANMQTVFEPKMNFTARSTTEEKTFNKTNNSKAQENLKSQVLRPSSFQKITSSATNVSLHERQVHSPTYSQFSAVTNTTQSRFKTKAAMKGYENGNIDITIQTEEAKSRPTCKLTELADIALGHDDKHDDPAVAPKANQITIQNASRVVTPEYVTLSVVDGHKDGNFAAIQDNNKKTTETQGSTSSKTIMHSSIIKAAVEEHGKTQTTNRIIIPERPFKNIGLEEKETITFQKPKTTSVNLLMDDNSVSTASYSDRDDFDFNSMSCDDDTSIKTSNEKNLKSSSDSSSSRATAKTFENKSLIMGRIFKNASTKAKATTVKSVGVQKDHTPKADLNQLFDELRNDGVAIVKTKNTEDQQPQCKDVVVSTHQEVFSTLKPQMENPKVSIETKRNRTKAPVKKLKSNKKSEKEFCKLQTELGMSQEEIEQLIDEGQRKSKRRCATNRPKKLVETWSSDEYEEFLSTKDIIALIEEKEKQEQRRKRKSSVVSDIKEKSLLTSAGPTLAPAESSTRKNFTVAPIVETARNQKTVLKASSSSTTTTAVVREKEKTQKGAAVVKEIAAKTKSITVKQTEEENTSKSKTPGKRGRKPKNPGPTSNQGHKEEVINKKSVIEKIEKAAPPTIIESTAASETDDNLYLLDIKRNLNNNNNSRKNKTKKDKSVKESSVKETKEVKEAKQILDINVNSSKPQNRETESTEKDEVIDTKRRSNCATTTASATTTSGSSGVGNKKNKGKRKAQTVKSPIRKRQAAEKLYYWSSSSSDEDFGRINEHEPEFENTEQYQKHGWIVGDSHKKLVTLLAIAKGNKKQVENCGVKKNVSKRKN